MKAFVLFAPFLFFLIVFQTSFLAHFPVWGIVPNVVLLFVLTVSFFEHTNSWLGIFLALIGGFLLDVFSRSPFGLWVFVLLFLVLAVKGIVKVYVRLPIFQKT